MQSSTFGSLVKAQPSLILFVPLNDKNRNKEILDMVCVTDVSIPVENCIEFVLLELARIIECFL